MELLREALLNPVIAFHAGVFAEALLLIGPSSLGDLRTYVRCLGMAPAGIMGRADRKYDAVFGLAAITVRFCVLFAAAFKDKLRPRVTPEIFLIWNLLFLYMFFRYASASLPLPFAGLALTPVLFAFANAVTEIDRSMLVRMGISVWFLLLIAGVAIARLAIAGAALLWSGDAGAATWNAFFAGAAFLYVIVTATHGSDIPSIARAYGRNPEVQQPLRAIAFVAGFCLLGNVQFDLVSDLVLIPLIIAISHAVSTWKPVVSTPPIVYAYERSAVRTSPFSFHEGGVS